MKKIGKVLVISILSVLIVGCGKDRTREEKVSAMIDKVDSPFFIANVNLQNLMDKSEIMKEGTLPFTYYQVISFFLAVELTGIDYNTDAQLVVGEGEAFLPNFYGIFKVENQELFTTLLETEANATIQEKDGMKFAIKESEQYCVVWDEDFAVISNIPINFASLLSGSSAKEGQKMVDRNIEMIKAAEDGEVNSDYVNLLSKEADMAMMYNGKGFYSYMLTMAVDNKEDMEKMKDLYEGMSYEMYLNFNKGNVELEVVSDLDAKLKEQLSFISKDGVSDKMLKYGRTKNPLLVGSYKASVHGMLDYFKEMNADDYQAMVDDMAKDGLEIEEIKDALSGELVYIVDAVEKKEEVYDFGYDEPIVIKQDKPIFGIVLGVSDKSIIEKKIQEAMTAGDDELVSTDPSQGIEEAKDMPKIEVLPNDVLHIGEAYLFLSNESLFMSNDLGWTNLIATGKGVKVGNPDGVVNNKAFGMFADFSSIKNYQNMDADIYTYAEMFESFSGSADIDGGKFILNMTDKSENSLKVMTMMIGSALAEFEKSSNPDMEAELEEAIKESEDAFNKLEESMPDGEKIDKAVDDALNQIEQELKK